MVDGAAKGDEFGQEENRVAMGGGESNEGRDRWKVGRID